MAHDHAREDVSASPLILSIPGPIAGDPWTYLSSNPNAALSIAGAYESVDDQTVTDVQADLMASPQYQLAVTSLERDLELIERQKPANAKERRRFVLDLFAARLYFGGTLEHRFTAEVLNAA